MRRLYQLLLRLYPAHFREEYAAPMERQFTDEMRDTEGRRARAWFGVKALADLAFTLPVEIARETRQDLRYAVRAYRQRSFVTVLALATLALAIGATTGIFSVLNAVLIRSLPFREPDQLVEMLLSPTNAASGRAAFRAWRDNSSYLAGASGFSANEVNVSVTGEAVRVRLAETTADFLSMLGAETEIGRGFAEGEDIPGRNGVAVIGYGLWQQLYGGDSRALGSTIRLNGVPMTVIGVAPQGLDYPHKSAVWTPTVYDLARIPKPDVFGWETIGRLKSGISLTQASERFEAEARRALAGEKRLRIPGFSMESQMVSLRDRLAGPVRSASLLLMGMVALVLLIACANIAHLLLSRTTERRQELAVRAALGASRARLTQQLITEAIALTTVATVAGLAVAHWTAQLAQLGLPAELAARQYTVLDWRVIAFAAGLAVLTGVVFGVLPASMLGRMQPGQDVIRTQPGSRSTGAGRMRLVLTAMQAALTVALVAVSFSMGRSFLKLLGTDLAFRTERAVALNVSLSGTRYETDDLKRQYFSEAIDRLRSVPGVEHAAAVTKLPLISVNFAGGLFALDSGERGTMAVLNVASPGYFQTMGSELLEGREFTESDSKGSERVAIISDDLARSYGRQHLIGRKIMLPSKGRSEGATIIGIVRAQRMLGPMYQSSAQIFRPLGQSAPGFVTLVAKVRGNPEPYLSVCRDVVRRADKDVAVFNVNTLDQHMAETLARPRFYTAAILFFAGFALLLAVVGTHGVAVYSVAQRTHEIGVRIAVGASPGRMRGMLFGQSMAPVAMGMLAGVAGAVLLGRFLRSLIASVEPTGVWICSAAACVLLAATAIAVWAATNRIVRMDPTAALKAE